MFRISGERLFSVLSEVAYGGWHEEACHLGW